MSDITSEFLYFLKPTPERPLLGQTVLAVTASHVVAAALHDLSLKSGARFRRADCLASATRHLVTYRPSIAIVDCCLPDGSGRDFVAQQAAARPRIPLICRLAGKRPDAGQADLALPRPLPSLGGFQQTLLAHLPLPDRPAGLRLVKDSPGTADPGPTDPGALANDANLIADLLAGTPSPRSLAYAGDFASALGRCIGAPALVAAGERLTGALAAGRSVRDAAANLGALAGKLAQPSPRRARL